MSVEDLLYVSMIMKIPGSVLLVMFTFALLDIPAAGSWGVWDNCLHLAAGSEQDQDDNQEIHISAFW